MTQRIIIPPDKWICSRAEIMDLFEVHWNTHSTRFVSPGFPREQVVLGRNQGYNLKVYLKWLIDVHYGATNSDAMAKEKLRHEKYKADKAQYDAEERIKLLIPRDEVVRGLGLLLSGIKNKFLAWIKRLPGLLANKSLREIEPILQEELYIILSDLAKGIGVIVPEHKRKKIEKNKVPKPKPAAKKKGRPKKKLRKNE